MDKARRTFPIAVEFREGEIPTASKLNGLATQTRVALNLVEFMLGDLWNQAGDTVLSPVGNYTGNALHITNLARSLGRMSLLNSFIPNHLSASMVYDDNIGTRHSGDFTGMLKYKPASTPSAANMILAGVYAPLVQASFVASPASVNSADKWCVDSEGRLYTYEPIPVAMRLQYVPTLLTDADTEDSSEGAAWNVIPDPTTWTGNFTGVKISFANGVDASTGFHIWLPPRKSLGATKTINCSPSSVNNISATPEVAPLLTFQSDTVAASIINGNHYRYRLPNEILSLGAGTALPKGFIYLWDEEVGSIVEGCTFYTPNVTTHQGFKVRVEGENLATLFGALGAGIVTGDGTTEALHLPTNYISRFKVIVAGNSIAKQLISLKKTIFNHTHKVSDGTIPISHHDLTDNYYARLLFNNGILLNPSSWFKDDHIQYLHRGGSRLAAGNSRDLYDNALFDKFVVASSGDTTKNIILGTKYDSYLTSVLLANEGLYISGSGLPVTIAGLQCTGTMRFNTGSDFTQGSDNYILFDDNANEYHFVADGSINNSKIVAGTLSGKLESNNLTIPILASQYGELGRWMHYIVTCFDGFLVGPQSNYVIGSDYIGVPVGGTTGALHIPIHFPTPATIYAPPGGNCPMEVIARGTGSVGLWLEMFSQDRVTFEQTRMFYDDNCHPQTGGSIALVGPLGEFNISPYNIVRLDILIPPGTSFYSANINYYQVEI